MKFMEQRAGLIGTVSAAVTAFLAWLNRHEAELRTLWLFLSVLLVFLTVSWWVKKWVVWIIRCVKKRRLVADNEVDT